MFGLELSWQVVLCLFVMILTLGYRTSHVVKYYTKLTIFYGLAMSSAMFILVYALPRPRNWRNHRLVKVVSRYMIAPLVGLHMEVRGFKEHIDKTVAGIIVMNHQSSVDIVPVFAHIPDQTVALAKKELFYAGSFGLAAWLCGTVYIDRGNSAKAIKTMKQTVDQIKSEKLKVMVFPEGTRNHKGSMLPFRKGAFHIAVQAQVPIIPVVLSSYDGFYSKSKRIFDEGRMIMQALPPIPTEGLTADDVGELAEKTRGIMLEAFDKLNLEVKQPVAGTKGDKDL